jgi:hypothetical protein
MGRKRIACGARRNEKALGAADEGISAFIEAKELISGASNADANGFSDNARRLFRFAEPERARCAKIEAVVATVDLKSGSEASRAAGEIEKPHRLTLALHELDAFERFKSADEDCGSGSGRFAHDIEHEVRTVVEENVDVAWGEIHRTNARSWAAKMMSGGIAGRVGFCFHDAAAEAARREIVNDDFSDKEARQLDGVGWKLGAAEAANREFLERRLQSVTGRGHGMQNQRDNSFCRSL